VQTRPAGQGTTGSDVTCLECGGRNAADRRFCRRCGASLELVALAGPAAAAPVEPPLSTGPAASGPVARAPGSGIPDPPRVVPRPPGSAVPEPPKVVPRAPAVESRAGFQPAEQQARPPAVRPEAMPAAVEPGGAMCPQCGTANPPGRRFCRRCGAALTVAAGGELEPALGRAPRLSWWQRLKARFRRGGGKEREAQPSRSARAAYRRTLDVRYRVYRVLAVFAGVGLLVGSLGLAGYNPISGARGLWNRFFPRYEQVDQLEAAVSPETSEDPSFAGGAAVDGDPATEWAAIWLQPGADQVEECQGENSIGGADSALVVTLPEPTKITKVSLQAGLPEGDADRAFQWSPTRVELQYDNGECDQVDLDETAGFQDHRLSGPETTTVRLTVLAAAPPTETIGSKNLVGFGEVRIYQAR
jgi:ribosomal protein L40E